MIVELNPGMGRGRREFLGDRVSLTVSNGLLYIPSAMADAAGIAPGHARVWFDSDRGEVTIRQVSDGSLGGFRLSRHGRGIKMACKHIVRLANLSSSRGTVRFPAAIRNGGLVIWLDESAQPSRSQAAD